MTIGQLPRGLVPAFTLLLSLLAGAPLGAQQLELAGLFGDHMVLQAGEPLLIWGTAAPREPLRLSMGEASVSGYAGTTGRFALTLPPMKPGGPFELVLRGRDDGNELLLHDLLIGEVWIAAGGANMALPVSMAGDALETVRAAQHPQLRVTQLPTRAATSPSMEASLEWQAV
ncbi:MAG: sialate O-acetylesterase, partial [Pseudohongiellaceae bacterium]